MPKSLHLPVSVAIVGVVGLTIAWGLNPSLFDASAHRSASTSSPPSANSSAIRHAVVIVMEDAGMPGFLTQAPYQSYLAATYGDASQFYGTCHGSLPDYAAMTSGRFYPCGTASIPLTNDRNIADLLESQNDSWMGYFESMTTPCETTSAGLYAAYHNPFLLYRDIRDSSSRCDTHLVNSSAFNASVLAGTLPTLSYYVPNLYDDGELSGASGGDLWLDAFLSPILNSSNPIVRTLANSTAFYVVHDEGSDLLGFPAAGAVDPWCQQVSGQPLAACGGLTYLTVVSLASHHTSYAEEATDFSLESTIEWQLGLGSDGGYDSSPAFPPMVSLFDAGVAA